MATEAPRTDAELVRLGARLLGDRLPPGWSLSLEEEFRGDGGPLDGIITLVAPGGESGRLILEAKRVLARRDVSSVASQAEYLAREMPHSSVAVVARYLAPTVREALVERGVSYIDATGNMRVQLSTPALFVGDRGADKDPWRGPGRPRGSLKGGPASQIVRALVDVAKPMAVRELVDLSRTSTGATYRVLDYLTEEELIDRASRGPIIVPDWRRLLERWSRDYGFLRSNRVSRFIEPRGLPALLVKSAQTAGLRYAVTGSVAAARWAPYADARNAMIYVENLDAAADRWGLRPADAGVNVLLAEPESSVVFDRTTTTDDLVAAAPAQVAVDLMTGPGRSPAEADALLDWMSSNESSWRL